jgi:phenylacetate-CoA oxygenase PaaI subunit
MISDTSGAASTATARLIARIADSKYFLGRHMAEWCAGAPTLESAVAAAAMAQDELGHARALYPLLRTLDPAAGPENEPETRTRFVNMAVLDRPFADWADFIAANFLVDGALTLLFEAAVASSYEPLAGRARKALQEERTHAMHAEPWVRRLARESGAVRSTLEAALRRAWWDALCWFGPAGPRDALAAAVLDATPDALRARFLGRFGPILVAERLDLPVKQGKNGAWKLTAPLPWDRWDAATYRLRPISAAETPAPATRSVAPGPV